MIIIDSVYNIPSLPPPHTHTHTHTQFNEQKTTSDCRLRWENCLNPGVYNGSWSKEEEKRLMKVANQHQCTDWKAIARDIGVG